MFTIEFIEGEGPKVESATEAGSGKLEAQFEARIMAEHNLRERENEAHCKELEELEAQLAEAQDLRQDANAAFEAMRKAGLMAGTRPVTLSNLTAKAIERADGYRMRLQECGARNIELEGQLAEAKKQLNQWKREFSGAMPNSEIDARVVAANARAQKAEARSAMLLDEFRMVAIDLHVQKHYAVTGDRWDDCEDCARYRALLPEYAKSPATPAPAQEGENK